MNAVTTRCIELIPEKSPARIARTGQGTFSDMSWRRTIEVGQRYVGTGPTPFGTPSRNVWCVGAIKRAIDGLFYAELINEREPGRTKTISTEALSDPRFYRPVAAEAQSH